MQKGGMYHFSRVYDYGKLFRDRCKKVTDDRNNFVAWSCGYEQAAELLYMLKKSGAEVEYSENCWNRLQSEEAEAEKKKQKRLELEKEIKGIKTLAEFPEIENCELWNHQRQSYRYVSTMWRYGQGCLLYAETRTGKTRTTLYLLRDHCRGGAMVFCPKNVIPVWLREAWKIGMDGLVTFDSGTWSDRAARIDEDLKEGKRCIYVINYAAALNEDMAVVARKMNAIVADESQKIKMMGGETQRAFESFSQVPLRIGLSGTPMTQGPQDVWGQYRFLCPDAVDAKYYRFLSRYCEIDKHNKVIGVRDADGFNSMFYSHALHVSRDVLDLPPVHHIDWPVKLNSKSMSIIDDIMAGVVIKLKENEELSIACVATELIRMQQITSGFLPRPSGGIDEVNTAKEDALVDILESLPPDEPVVVFGTYTEDLDRIERAAKRVGVTSSRKSGKINQLSGWQNGETSVLACQTRAGGIGEDMVRAHYCIYYSAWYSLEDYLQSHDRIHGPGQENPCTYYHLSAQGTINDWIYYALQNRLNMTQTLIGGLTGKLIIGRPEPTKTGKQAARELISKDTTLLIDINDYLTTANPIKMISVLDQSSGPWTARKRQWKKAGVHGDVFSTAENTKGSISTLSIEQGMAGNADANTGLSGGFDPVLCELMIRGFCPDGGKILDPFAGGSVCGLVAGTLGYHYYGCEIRAEQVERSREKLKKYKIKGGVTWHNADSAELDTLPIPPVDLIMTSPPFAGLEVYSEEEGDLSVISKGGYEIFLVKYKEILRKACDKLKTGGYACLHLGEVRDKKGNYLGFVPDTVKIMKEIGLDYYNEMILAAPTGGIIMTSKFEVSKKAPKTHCNVLVFRR
jgi:hypothetical protein